MCMLHTLAHQSAMQVIDLLNPVMDPRLTFNRASTKTYFGQDGVMRTTRQNLLLWSEDLSNAAWGAGGTTISSNVTASPRGDLTADMVVEDTTTGTHRRFAPNVSVVLGQAYTMAVRLKYAGRHAQLSFSAAQFGANGASFNLQTGTVGNTSVGTTATITALANGWYLATMTATCTAAGTNTPSVWLSPLATTGTGAASYTGDGVSGAYVWGAQVEASSTVGDYYPTSVAINGEWPLEYDPATARTNLCWKSEDNTIGAAVGGTGSLAVPTANYTAAPDGSLTADRWVFALNGGTTTADISYFGRAFTITALPAVWSFWIKSNTAASYTLWTRVSSLPKAFVVTPAWTRLSFTDPTGAANFIVGLRGGNYGGLTNSDFADVSIWGVQIEVGTVATAYIPTSTNAPVTVCDPAGRSVWEARTNLLIRSEEIDNAAWTKSNMTVVANAGVAPDGNMTADSLTDTASTNGKEAAIGYATYGSGLAYTFSVFAKQVSGVSRLLRINWQTAGVWAGSTGASFDLATGAITALDPSTTATSVSLPNGWWRFSITSTTVAAGVSTNYMTLRNSANSPGYLGDGTTVILLWGAQLEQAAFAGPYIPTAAAQATRTLETANCSNLPTLRFNQSEGTLIADAIFGSGYVGGFYGTTGFADHMEFRNNVAVIRDAAGVQVSSGATLTAGRHRVALAYRLGGSYATAVDGVANANANIPAPAPMVLFRFGSTYSTSAPNAPVRRMRFYPSRLSNTELQALTA